PKPAAQKVDSTQVAQKPATGATPAPASSTDTSGAAPKAAPPLAAMSSDTLPVDTIHVRTKKYELTLSTLGGGPISILLNDYKYLNKQPIEMLVDGAIGVPDVSFAGGAVTTSKMNFRSSVPRGTYDATTQPFEITYTFRSTAGGEIVRRYRFYPDRYDFDFNIQVNEREKFGFERQFSVVWNSPMGLSEPDLGADNDAIEAVAMMSGSREKLKDYQDSTLNQSLTGNTSWVGVRAKYFSNVLIPRSREADGCFAKGVRRAVVGPSGKYTERKVTVGLDLSLPNVPTVEDSFTVFVGPLDYPLMASYKVGLQDIFGIGTTAFVGWMVKPFALAVIWLLPKMYTVVPNYGFVIILFAVLVKLVTLPLSLKSFKSMAAMKELQPKIDELRKRLKNNPQQLNQETMKLYKAHGVNPLSGCLPILLQMPLFFGLFSVFRQTILLRQAPFIGFITDLSRGASSYTDPYIVLVVLMIVFQFVSQKLTMASNQQNKMFLYIMPIFMGWLFYRFAAGLVLYWTCFSAFSLVDWYLFRRTKNPEVQSV
ncbi:MAG TPA: membrane protein insertase YidC, partial [Candidatus Acidoferrum sp.]|nr:membrane protein insertase YidC [Candidatus Acidoferrum sp.]